MKLQFSPEGSIKLMKKNGPWIINTTKRAYKNPWIEVTEDQVVRPDGSAGIYGIVRIKPGISVLPIDDDNNVYLINEFKYPLGKHSIETAAGGTDSGQTALQSAKQELREELGIMAKEWTNLGVVHPITSFIDSPNYLFMARKLEFTKPELEVVEQMDILKVSLAQAVDMVMDGRITEQKSCCLILKAARLLDI